MGRSADQLLEFVGQKLDLGPDNDLNAGLAGTDDAGGSGSPNLLLVYQQAVLHLQTQTGDAVVSAGHVVRAADAFQDGLGHGGEVAAAQFDAEFGLIVVILAAGGL